MGKVNARLPFEAEAWYVAGCNAVPVPTNPSQEYQSNQINPYRSQLGYTVYENETFSLTHRNNRKLHLK